MECSCCYGGESLIDPGCGHFIHEDCLKKLVDQFCPICYGKLNISDEILEKIKENKLHLQEEFDEEDRINLINSGEDTKLLIDKIKIKTNAEILEYIKVMADYFKTLRYLPIRITINYINTHYIDGVIYNSLMKHTLDRMIEDIKNGDDDNTGDENFDYENERLKNIPRKIDVNFDL